MMRTEEKLGFGFLATGIVLLLITLLLSLNIYLNPGSIASFSELIAEKPKDLPSDINGVVRLGTIAAASVLLLVMIDIAVDLGRYGLDLIDHQKKY